MALIRTDQQALRLLNVLQGSHDIGFDTESSGPTLIGKDLINPFKSTLTGFSVAISPSKSWYIPVGHKNTPRVSYPVACKLLKCIAEREGVVWAHNWKWDLHAVRQYLWDDSWRPNIRDSQIVAWLTGRHDGSGSYSLKSLSKRWFGVEPQTFDALTQGASVAQLSPHQVSHYACADAEYTLLIGQMCRVPSVMLGALKFEHEFIDVLLAMEKRGVGVSFALLEEAYVEAEKNIKKLTKRWKHIFPDISISSPIQVKKLYEQGYWDATLAERSKTGESTNHYSMIKQLEACKPGSKGHTAAEIRIEYQKYSKVATTYTLGLIEIANQYPDRRLHPSYFQTGTDTGRLASSYPNAQNIPNKTDIGRKVLSAFQEGEELISADYSQIELRIIAHYAGGILADAYLEGKDIHQATADALGISRGEGKTVNFAVQYGAGEKRLAAQLKCSAWKAKNIRKKMLSEFPGIEAAKQRILDCAYANGWVETLGGRRRYFPELVDRPRDATKDTGDMYERWSKERQAVNAVAQGSAADIVKKGMLALHNNGVEILAQIHDDVICYARGLQDDDIRLPLEGSYKINVPLVCDPKRGMDWEELK